MIGISGSRNHKDFLASYRLETDLRKIKGSGRIGSKRFGSFDGNYDSNSGSMTLYSKPSFLTRCMSKLGYLGYAGLGILGGLATYSSMPVEDPFRVVYSIGAAIGVGLLSFFLTKKPKYSFKI